MKVDNSNPLKLKQLNVREGVTVGAMGTTSVNDTQANLTYYPAIGIVIVEKRDRPAVLVPLSNVRSMEVAPEKK
jgi:hypothetical protein